MSTAPIVVDCEQGSDAWRAARCGLLTGCRADAMLASVKRAGEASKRRDLRIALVCERLTGVPAEAYVNPDMRRGRELEAAAIRAYEARRGLFVSRVGFLKHPSLAAGCSPDGLLEHGRGLLEVKVPRASTHVEYWKSGGKLPAEYEGQILHNLWITGADYCDFVSWDPRFPLPLQLYCVRTERVEFAIGAYERAAWAFLQEVDAELAALEALVGTAA